jgi:hypothetical protein
MSTSFLMGEEFWAVTASTLQSSKLEAQKPYLHVVHLLGSYFATGIFLSCYAP